MKLFDDAILAQACDRCNVPDLANATIAQMVAVARDLETGSGIPFIRMDQGSPSLPINRYGVEAEKAALDAGLCGSYPPADGIPVLKEAASRFVKAFIDIDISPKGCIPTVGSIEASFACFLTVTKLIKGRDKILFIDPGFPIQKQQLNMLGIGWRSFDVYGLRGEPLRDRIEEEFSRGDIAAIIYSNPNNPTWVCLDESELRIIGELATKYDVVVLEDLAYFCMDYRHDLGHPGQAPYLPSVARYTDNYVMMLSASKIFSYAGQRVAICCISDALFGRHFENLGRFFGDAGVFGDSLVSSALYPMSSGCTSSAQYGYAAMMNLSCEGVINFVEDTRAYETNARRMKEIFTSNGFHIVYDMDVEEKVGDGFFFSLGYGSMSSAELVVELMKYGISCISLSTTGSLQRGVRGCSARMREELFPELERRAAEFNKDHSNKCSV